MAAALAKRGIISETTIQNASDETMADMGAALGCPREIVPLQLGGLCTLTARHGSKIGWTPEFLSTHILDTADEEVALILDNLKI